MGNHTTDAREVKVFNIFRNIPVISQIYRLPRAIVYAAKGNRQQVRRCWQIKISNLNPYKCAKNIAKGIAALKSDLKTGIWIGKRNIGYFPFGLSAVPGYDLMHWAVMVNHTIYQVLGADIEGYCLYSISEYAAEGENFEWFVTDLEPLLSKKQLEKVVNQFRAGKKKYSLAAVLNSEAENCQTFAINFIALACKQSPEELLSRIIVDDDEKDYGEVQVLQ